MTRIIFASVLALAATATASFRIPADLPDGVYGVTWDASGASVHKSLDGTHTRVVPRHVSAPAGKGSLGLERRDYGAFCEQSGAVVAANDIRQAQITLGTACDQHGNDFVPGYSNGNAGARYAKFGQGAVFVCNYSSDTQVCRAYELNNDIATVQAKCGTVAGQ